MVVRLREVAYDLRRELLPPPGIEFVVDDVSDHIEIQDERAGMAFTMNRCVIDDNLHVHRAKVAMNCLIGMRQKEQP
jgi:hypothetical protein